MADFVGRALGIATGIGIFHAAFDDDGSWWVVLILAVATIAWTLGQVLLDP